jgi:hypothetical protein
MKTAFFIIISLFAAMPTHAALVVSAKINVLNDQDSLVMDGNGAPLSSGELEVPNDGAAVQVGYYDQASVANPFLGRWIPLTGEESNNSYFFSIGDNYVADGLIDMSFILQEQSIHMFDFPPSTSIPLAVRFYDHFSPFGAQHFNTVSNTSGAWNWKNENQSHIGLVIWDATNPALIWEGGGGSAYRTTIPIGVPEPSGIFLLVSVGGILGARRPRPRYASAFFAKPVRFH